MVYYRKNLKVYLSMLINKSKYLFVVTLHLLKCLLSDRGKPRRTEMLTEIAQKDEY